MGLFSFLGFGKPKGPSPAEAAQGYLNQVPGIAKQYNEPFIQQGQQAYNQAAPQYNAMSSNPTDYLNQIMQQYQPSQGYGYRENRLRDALGNTAAAGGFRGTSHDQAQQAELVNSLLGQDMQQYLGNVLGIQGTGLQGQENLQNRGQAASTDLASILGNNLGTQGSLAFHGRQQEIANQGAKRNAILKLLGGLAGGAIGAFGGPAGIAAGAQMGSGLAGGMGGQQPQQGMDWNRILQGASMGQSLVPGGF